MIIAAPSGSRSALATAVCIRVQGFWTTLQEKQMPKDTYETAPTRFVEAGSIRFAYRRFGRSGGPVLLLLNYFAANLDNWDPKVTNGLAADRDVILVDYPGIGGSSGETPSTVAALTTDCVEFCRVFACERM
jgi:hypothetical protein